MSAPAATVEAVETVDLLVIGDVHGDWDDVDAAFLEGGYQGAAIFVGDFGDEDVDLVARVAALRCAKVVMLGNHDAWLSMSAKNTVKVERQLELLGSSSLAYSSLPLAEGRLALVGARPFSWGGGWSRHRALYQKLYGVGDEVTSTERIIAAAEAHPQAGLVLVGHNGPRGLGDTADAIFGCDFRKPHSDWGDADLRHALDRLRGERGRRVIATVAGHMHDQLRFGGQRRRVAEEGGTRHFNAAVVPRHQGLGGGGRLRHFLRLTIAIAGATVSGAEDIWVGDDGVVALRRPLSEPLL